MFFCAVLREMHLKVEFSVLNEAMYKTLNDTPITEIELGW